MHRRVPRTYNRAATAVVQGRLHVERARDELGLAIDILSELNGAAPEPAVDDGVRTTSSIREVVAELERTERALRAAWSN